MSSAHISRAIPSLAVLRAFEAVVRLGSVTAAAGELGVTHGAISRHVGGLESYLGTPLFERRGRGLRPTERARVYLVEVAGALDRLAQATEAMREPAAVRVIRVNASHTFVMRWLIPRLGAFQVDNPKLEVRLSASFEPAAQVAEPFDVIIRRGAMRRPGFISRRFLEEPNLPVAAPALLARHPVDSPAALLQAPLLHTDTRPTAWTDWFALAGLPTPAPPGQRFEHYYFTLEAAVRGLGFAIGPLPLITDDLDAGRLVPVLPGPVSEREAYHVLHPAGIDPKSRIARLVEWLAAQGSAGDR